MSRRPQRASKRKNHRVAELEAEITRLHQELANIHATLKQLEQGGADAFLTRRIAELEEGQRVARGQAVEAVVARSGLKPSYGRSRMRSGKRRACLGGYCVARKSGCDNPNVGITWF